MDSTKLYAKVEEAIKRKNYDYAIITLKNQLLKYNPNDVKARRLLRATVLEKYKIAGFPPASQVWSKGLVSRIKMIIGKMMKKWEMVIDEAENFLLLDPKNLSVLQALGEACVAAGYMDTAISVFENILAFDGSYADALKALGKIYQGKEELEKAQQYFQRAYQVAPTDMESAKLVKDLAAQITANTYGQAKSSGDLVKDKEKAQDLEAEHSMLRTDEDYARAIERTKKKLDADPNNKKELRRLGELYQKIGQIDDAIETFSRILELDATMTDIRVKISECKIAKAEHIIHELEEKLKQQPANEGIKQQLAKARRNKLEVEIQEYAAQSKDQPTNYDLRLKLATALMQTGKIDDAISHLQVAVNDPRKKPLIYTMMGQAFTQKKEFELAVEQFQNALKLLNPKERQYKDTLYYLALAYESAGKAQDAIETYTTIYKEDINYRDVQARLKKLKG